MRKLSVIIVQRANFCDFKKRGKSAAKAKGIFTINVSDYIGWEL